MNALNRFFRAATDVRRSSWLLASVVVVLTVTLAVVANAANFAMTLATPNQTAPPGGNALYTGSIVNTSGHAITLDIQVEFLTSPESELWTLDLAPEFLALQLELPPGGYSGPLFTAGWDPSLTGGLYGVGRLVLTDANGVDGVAAASFTLSTPGAGPFCTSQVNFRGLENSVGILDSLDHPIVASANPVNGSVSVGTTDGHFWKTALIAKNVGSHASPSLVVDAFQAPHVAYYDEVAGRLVHATNPGTGWVNETIDNASGAGRSPSLAIDQLGQLHVSYYDSAKRQLRYAARSNGSWTPEVVDTLPGAGVRSALATDEIGQPYIAYYSADEGKLRLAHRAGNGWTTEVVDGTGHTGLAPSLRYHTGTFWVSYGDSTPGHHALRMASGVPGAWSAATVDSGGDCGSASVMTLDGFDNPRIGYWDAATQTLRYASKTGPVWILEDVAANSAGAISLARGTHDEPVFSFAGSTDGLIHLSTVGQCPVTIPLFGEPTGTDATLPTEFAVMAARPNPFRSTSVITFASPVRAEGWVRVYDAAGRVVAEPLHRFIEAGMTQVTWDGADRSGRKLPAGTYLVQVRVGANVKSARVTLIR